MPVVRIDITGPKPPAWKRALLSGVRSAVVESLNAADSRVTVRIVETPAEDTDMPTCRTERFTVVEVLMYEGRSHEMKAAASAAIRKRLGHDPGIEPSEVSVYFRDATPIDLDVLPGEAGSG
jgi:phenylpyruvate tautomerase PptA (4-oxalocrotonate tautomerase family)